MVSTEPEIKPAAVQLGVALNAQFSWAEEPKNDEEKASREVSNAVLQVAAEKLQPIVSAMLVELLEAQSKHYIVGKS